MNSNVTRVLEQAFDLIEAGQLDNARRLLKPFIETDKDNPDIWWLFAHSVTDKESARLALSNVLRIDNTYPDARELLEQLASQFEITNDDLEKDPSFIPALPSSLPGLSSAGPERVEIGAGYETLEDVPDYSFEEDQPDTFYRRPAFYIPVIVLLLLAALAVVLLKPFSNDAPQLPSTTDEIPTDSTVPIIPPTNEIIAGQERTDALSETEIGLLISDLAPYDVSKSDIATVKTSIGNSLVLSICTTSGRELRDVLPRVMTTLAKSSKVYSAKFEAIGVLMRDCSSNETVRWIGSTMADAVSYADGTLSESDFQARWTPITDQ